jgi:uncharacterized Ntn-hydrolase superfamily protein
MKLRAWLLIAAFAAAAPAPLSATWSIVAIDARTGRIVVSSATCVAHATFERFPASGLMDIQAIVVPGAGAAVAQAGLDRTRMNQLLIEQELAKGTPPERILALLRQDPSRETRQFGIVDRAGRAAGFSGVANGRVALHRTGRVPGTDVHYAIQGNLLASRAVVDEAVRALVGTQAAIEDRVMAAMEAADAAGGDRRCSCRTRPAPTAPCATRHALVAYLLATDPDDGGAFDSGGRRVYIDVTDENIRPDEDANPVVTLRKRYDALKGTQQTAAG